MNPVSRDAAAPVRLIHKRLGTNDPSLPLEILLKSDLEDDALRMYAIIYWYKSRDKDHPTLDRIGAQLKRDRNYVARALRKCVDAGLLGARPYIGTTIQYELIPLDEAGVRDTTTRPKGTGYHDDFERLYALWPWPINKGKALYTFTHVTRPTATEVETMAQAIVDQHAGITDDRIRFAGSFDKWLADRGWEQSTATIRSKWEDRSKRTGSRRDPETPYALCQRCGTRRVFNHGDRLCQPCQLRH